MNSLFRHTRTEGKTGSERQSGPFRHEIHQLEKTRVEAGFCGVTKREQKIHILHQ